MSRPVESDKQDDDKEQRRLQAEARAMGKRKEGLAGAGQIFLEQNERVTAVVYVGPYVQQVHASKCDIIIVAQPKAENTPEEYDRMIGPLLFDAHKAVHAEPPFSHEVIRVIKTAEEIDYMAIEEGYENGLYRVDRDGAADLPPHELRQQ